MMKYLCILIFSLVVKNRAFLTTNMDVEATARNNPVLMRLLQTVDAANTDERLLDVSLQLLKSVCVCMRETLKAKQLESASFNGDTNSLQAEDNVKDPSRDLYQNIYNKTCFDLKNEVASKVNKSAKVSSNEEKEYMLKSVCGKTPNHTIINVHDTQKQDPITKKNDTTLEDILYQTFVKTRHYHRFRARKYSLYKQKEIQMRVPDEHSVIVILTLYPENNRSHLINNQTKLINELNKTLYTHSPIDIDIIDARYRLKENISEEILTSKEATDCALKSIYIFLFQSEKRNKTKVFKVLHRDNSIKVYIDVASEPYHSDYTKMCCSNKTDIMLCKIEFTNEIFESKEITTAPHIKEKSENFKDIISKIKYLVKLYDKKLKKKKLKRSTTSQTFINQNEIKSYLVNEGDIEKYTKTIETAKAYSESNSLLNYTDLKEIWMNRIFDDKPNHKKDEKLRTLIAQITVPDQKDTVLLKKINIKSNYIVNIEPNSINSKPTTSTEFLNIQKMTKYKANLSHYKSSNSQANRTSDLFHLQSDNPTERNLSYWKQTNNTFSTFPTIEKPSVAVSESKNSTQPIAYKGFTSTIAQLPIENTLEIVVTTNNKQETITINDLFAEPNIKEVNKQTVNEVTKNNNSNVSNISENSTSKEKKISICISLLKNTHHAEFSEDQSVITEATNKLFTSSFHTEDIMKAKDVECTLTNTNTEKNFTEINMTESPLTTNVSDIDSQGNNAIEESVINGTIKHSLEVINNNLSFTTTEVFSTTTPKMYYDLNLLTENVLDTTHSYNADVISDLTGPESYNTSLYNMYDDIFAGNRFTNHDNTVFVTFDKLKPVDETTTSGMKLNDQTNTSKIRPLFSALTDPIYFNDIYTLTDNSTNKMNKSSLTINNPIDKELNYTVFNQSKQTILDYAGHGNHEENYASNSIKTTLSQTFENRSNVTEEIFGQDNKTSNYMKGSNKNETERDMTVISQLYSTLPDNIGIRGSIQMEKETNNLMTMRNLPKTTLNQVQIKLDTLAPTLQPFVEKSISIFNNQYPFMTTYPMQKNTLLKRFKTYKEIEDDNIPYNLKKIVNTKNKTRKIQKKYKLKLQIGSSESKNHIFADKNIKNTVDYSYNKENTKPIDKTRTLKPALLFNESDQTTISNFINSKVYNNTSSVFALQVSGTDENEIFLEDYTIMNHSKTNPLKEKDEMKTSNNSMLYKVNASGTTDAETDNDLIIENILSKNKENIESDSYSTVLSIKYPRSTEPTGPYYFWANVLGNMVGESNINSEQTNLNYSFPSSTKKMEYLITTDSSKGISHDTIYQVNQKDDKTNANTPSPTIEVPTLINIATKSTKISPKNTDIIIISPNTGLNKIKSVINNSHYISNNYNISKQNTVNPVTNNPIARLTQSKHDSSLEVLKYSQANYINRNLNVKFNNMSATADISKDTTFAILNANTDRPLMTTASYMSNDSYTRDLKSTKQTIKVANKTKLEEASSNNMLMPDIHNTNDINKSTFIHIFDYYTGAFAESQRSKHSETPKISVNKDITETRQNKTNLNLTNYSSVESKTSVDEDTKPSVPGFSLTDTFKSSSKINEIYTNITNQSLNNKPGDETIKTESSDTTIIKTKKYWALTKVPGQIANDSKIEGIQEPSISDISFSDTTQPYKLSHIEKPSLNVIGIKNKTYENSIQDDDNSVKTEKNQDQKKSTFVTVLNSYYNQYDKSEEITKNAYFNIHDLNTTAALLNGENYHSKTTNSVTEAITTIRIGNKTSTLLLNDASILNKKNEIMSYTMNQYSSTQHGEKTKSPKDIDFYVQNMTKGKNPTAIKNLIHNDSSISSVQYTDVLNVHSLYTTKPYSYSMHKINTGTIHFSTERHIEKEKSDLYDGNTGYKPYLHKQNSKTGNNYSDTMLITTAAESGYDSTVKHSFANDFILNTAPTSHVTNQYLGSGVKDDFFQPKIVSIDIFQMNEASIQKSKTTPDINYFITETLNQTKMTDINSLSTLNISTHRETTTEHINILHLKDKIVNNTGNLSEIINSPDVTQNTTTPVLANNLHTGLDKEIFNTTKPYTSDNDNFTKGQYDVGHFTLSHVEPLANVGHNFNNSKVTDLTYSSTEIFDKVSPQSNELFTAVETFTSVVPKESNVNYTKCFSAVQSVPVLPFINKIYSTPNYDKDFAHSTSIAKENNVLINFSNRYKISKNLTHTTTKHIKNDNLNYPEIKEYDTKTSNLPVTENFSIVYKSNNNIKHNSKNEKEINNLKKDISNFTISELVTRNDMYSTLDADDNFSHLTMIAKNSNVPITVTEKYSLSDNVPYNLNQYIITTNLSYTTQSHLNQNKTNSNKITSKVDHFNIPYYQEDNILSVTEIPLPNNIYSTLLDADEGFAHSTTIGKGNNVLILDKHISYLGNISKNLLYTTKSHLNGDNLNKIEITGVIDNLNSPEIKKDDTELNNIPVTKSYSLVFESNNKVKHNSKKEKEFNNLIKESSKFTKSYLITGNRMYTLKTDDDSAYSTTIAIDNNVSITGKYSLSDAMVYNFNQYNNTKNLSYVTQPNLQENKTNSMKITSKVDNLTIPYYQEEGIEPSNFPVTKSESIVSSKTNHNMNHDKGSSNLKKNTKLHSLFRNVAITVNPLTNYIYSTFNAKDDFAHSKSIADNNLATLDKDNHVSSDSTVINSNQYNITKKLSYTTQSYHSTNNTKSTEITTILDNLISSNFKDTDSSILPKTLSNLIVSSSNIETKHNIKNIVESSSLPTKLTFSDKTILPVVFDEQFKINDKTHTTKHFLNKDLKTNATIPQRDGKVNVNVLNTYEKNTQITTLFPLIHDRYDNDKTSFATTSPSYFETKDTKNASQIPVTFNASKFQEAKSIKKESFNFSPKFADMSVVNMIGKIKKMLTHERKTNASSNKKLNFTFSGASDIHFQKPQFKDQMSNTTSVSYMPTKLNISSLNQNRAQTMFGIQNEGDKSSTYPDKPFLYNLVENKIENVTTLITVDELKNFESKNPKHNTNVTKTDSKVIHIFKNTVNTESNTTKPSYMSTLSTKALVDFGNETHLREPYLSHKNIIGLYNDKYSVPVTDNDLPKFMQSVHVFKLNPLTAFHANILNKTITTKSFFLTTPHTSFKGNNETNSIFASVTDSMPVINEIISNNTRFMSEVSNASLEPPHTEVYDITSQFHDRLNKIQMPAVTYNDNDSGIDIKRSSIPKSTTIVTYTTNKVTNNLYDNITSNIINKFKVASDIVDINKFNDKPVNSSHVKLNQLLTTKPNVNKAFVDNHLNNLVTVIGKNKTNAIKVLLTTHTQMGLGGSSVLNKAKKSIKNDTNKNNLTTISTHRLKPISVDPQKFSFNHQSPYIEIMKKKSHSLMITNSTVVKNTDSLENNIKPNKVSTTNNDKSSYWLPKYLYDYMYQTTQPYYLNPRNYYTNDTKPPSEMSGNRSRNRETNQNYATTDIAKPFLTDNFVDNTSFDTKPYYDFTTNNEDYKNIVKINTFPTMDNDSHKYLPENKDIDLEEFSATTPQFTYHVTQSHISSKAEDINVSLSKQQYNEEKLKKIMENNKETPMEIYLESSFSKENKNNSVTSIPFNPDILEDIFTKSEIVNINQVNIDNLIKTYTFNSTIVKIDDPLNSTSSLRSVLKKQEEDSDDSFKRTNNIIQKPRNIPVYTAIENVLDQKISDFDHRISENIHPYIFSDNYGTSISKKRNQFFGQIGRKPNTSFSHNINTTKSMDNTSNNNVIDSKNDIALTKPISTSSDSVFDKYNLYPKATLYTSAKMSEKNKNFYNMTTMTMPNMSKFTDSRTSISTITNEMPYLYGQFNYNLISLAPNMSKISNILNTTTTTTTTNKTIFKDILVKNNNSKPIMANIIRDLGQSTKFELTNANSAKHILNKTDVLRKVNDSANPIIQNSRSVLLTISKESTNIANATEKFVNTTRDTITPYNMGKTYQTLINTRRQQHHNITTSIEPMTILKNSKNIKNNKETSTITNGFHNQFKEPIFNDLHGKTIFITRRIMKNPRTEGEPEKINKSKIISLTNLSKFINVIKVPTFYTNDKFSQINGNEKTFVNNSNKTIHLKDITHSRQNESRKASAQSSYLETLPRNTVKIAKISKHQSTKSIIYNTYKALTEEELTLPPDVRKIITSFSTIYTKEINNMTSLLNVNSNKHQVNKIRPELKSKFPLRVKIADTLNKIKDTNNDLNDALIYDTLHNFTNNTYLHPIENLPIDTRKKLLKRINMNKNSPIVMMKTDDFLSFHQTVTRRENFYKIKNRLPVARYQIKTPRVTKMPKRVILKPRFNSLEVLKLNPIPPIPKEIVMQSDRDFYRDNFKFHHKPDQPWREKISEVRTKLEPQRRSRLQRPQKVIFEPVIDVPYYMPSHMKSYFSRNKVDSVRSFIYNEEKNQLNSRRHFKSPPKIENSEVAVDDVDPHEPTYLSVDRSRDQTQATSPRSPRLKKTIFFLSPTVPYKRYF